MTSEVSFAADIPNAGGVELRDLRQGTVDREGTGMESRTVIIGAELAGPSTVFELIRRGVTDVWISDWLSSPSCRVLELTNEKL